MQFMVERVKAVVFRHRCFCFFCNRMVGNRSKILLDVDMQREEKRGREKGTVIPRGWRGFTVGRVVKAVVCRYCCFARIENRADISIILWKKGVRRKERKREDKGTIVPRGGRGFTVVADRRHRKIHSCFSMPKK